MLVVPNVPGADVPTGKSDADNVEVSRWGRPRNFNFVPREHLELGTKLGLFEFERSRKYAGGRSYSLTGHGVMLERAVIQFALESIAAKGFLPLSPPVMVRPSA